MNIISNCCAGAEFYRLILKKEFQNPFIWSALFVKDLKMLIKTYKSINFKNIQIKKSEYTSNGLIKFKVYIDNKIDLHFSHYIFSNTDETIRKDNVTGNIYWKHIDEYVKDKYLKRLDTMLKLNEPPCFFIMCDRPVYTLTIDDIKEINDIQTNYKIILVSNKDLSDIKFRNNVKWINDDGHDHVKAVKNHYKEMLEFFK